MLTTGEEARQFLYVEDCCECLNILMNRFTEIKSKRLDVSSFEWIKIRDLAEMVASNFSGCIVMPGTDEDDVQRRTLNDPGKDILNYWMPRTDVETGIKYCIDVAAKG
jgi:nucleoside-diphosphate-sugar epimerase